jgi:hypothetical protein
MNKIFGLILITLFLLISENILSQNLFIVTLNNLDFGDVYIGYPKTVAHTDAGAAKFRIYHTRTGNRNVRITFTLPSSLVNGSYAIPVTFGSTTSAYSRNDLTTGRTAFNPSTPLTYNNLPRNAFLYIWLGGAITITTNVIPGIYTATITVTVVII